MAALYRQGYIPPARYYRFNVCTICRLCVLFLVSTLHVRSLKPCQMQRMGTTIGSRMRGTRTQRSSSTKGEIFFLFAVFQDRYPLYAFFQTFFDRHSSQTGGRERKRNIAVLRSATERVSTKGLKLAGASGGSGALVRTGIWRRSAEVPKTAWLELCWSEGPLRAHGHE